MMRLLVAIFAWMALPVTAQAEDNALFQYSTLSALIKGYYDGDLTFAQLAREGDTGIGTFNGLDGEMIGVDGAFFRMRADGRVLPVPPEEKSPFAMVVRWDPERSRALPPGLSLAGLEALLEQEMEGSNRFYALLVTGHFKNVRVRSVPAQTRPYPLLTEVVKQQAVFDFQEVDGVLVGFRIPAYAEGLNAPGYHFHFLRADHQAGGHLLGLTTGAGQAQVDRLDRLHLDLPREAAFGEAETRADAGEVKAVEKQR